ncbi:hypothetical protein GCM10029964_098640 [Kibdelosporangium lantanae]
MVIDRQVGRNSRTVIGRNNAGWPNVRYASLCIRGDREPVTDRPMIPYRRSTGGTAGNG